MSESLHVESIYKSYDGKNLILDNLSFHATEGEFIVLVGPSGCGKSTMLRAIAGLEPITSGSIKIGDKEVTHLAPKDRNVAMVFQDYALYPHKNVYDNIAFGLRMRKLSEVEIDARVQEAASKLNLTPFLDRRPAALSGGQRQRVAIGRAIVRKPDLFLFDEPLSNLDAKLRGEMRLRIARLHQELRATTVYVTHDQVEAMTLADRIIVLQGGKLQQVGSPLELYRRPANLFVAQFIGSPPMNIIEGVLQDEPAGLSFVGQNGIRFLIPEVYEPQVRERMPPSKKVKWGIRAENLKMVPRKPDDPCFKARVLVSEPLGPESTILVDFYGHELQLKIPEPHHPLEGELIDLYFSSRHLYMFDQESTEALVAFSPYPSGSSDPHSEPRQSQL